MKTKKVLHITFDMAIAGTEQVIRQLVENTDRNAYTPSIACIDGKIGDLGQELSKQGINISIFDRNPSGLDFKVVSKLRAFIRYQKIDILHCHQYTPYVYGLLASLGTKSSVIFTEHGRFYPDRSSWKRLILNPILSLKTDSITAISISTAQALAKYENFPNKKIEVIYNGIKHIPTRSQDRQLTKDELGIASDEIVVGTISRLDPIKNQIMMISAFKKVQTKHPNSKLLIVGDGPIKRELEEHVNKLHLRKFVIFTGFKVNPQKYLEIMDIFLLSSLSEGTSMTVLEAMAFAKPCVVTDVGGNAEIVEHKKTGLVTPSQDTIAFANSIIDIIENKELCKDLSQAARTRYDKFFSVEKMIISYHSLYSRVSSSHDEKINE